jgi:hypothetical protein
MRLPWAAQIPPLALFAEAPMMINAIFPSQQFSSTASVRHETQAALLPSMDEQT